MKLMWRSLIFVHHFWNDLVSNSFHYPCHHILVVSWLFIEVRLGLACFTPRFNIHKEWKIGDTKHLGQLWGLPCINLDNIDLFTAIALIQIIIDFVEIRHKNVAVLTIW